MIGPKGSAPDANNMFEFEFPQDGSFVRNLALAYFLVHIESLVHNDLKQRVIGTCARWKPHETLIENKSSGIQLIQDMRRAEAHYNVIGIDPYKDKIMRMNLELGALEAGNLWLPRFAPWLPEFEAILKFFPDYKIKDPIDALSQYLMRVRTKPAIKQAKAPIQKVSARSLKQIF